jgi:hypothetical protein
MLGVAFPHEEFFIECVEGNSVSGVVRGLMANKAASPGIKGHTSPDRR